MYISCQGCTEYRLQSLLTKAINFHQVARRANNWTVVGSRPSKVLCITVLTGELSAVASRHSATLSVDGLGSGIGKW